MPRACVLGTVGARCNRAELRVPQTVTPPVQSGVAVKSRLSRNVCAGAQFFPADTGPNSCWQPCVRRWRREPCDFAELPRSTARHRFLSEPNAAMPQPVRWANLKRPPYFLAAARICIMTSRETHGWRARQRMWRCLMAMLAALAKRGQPNGPSLRRSSRKRAADAQPFPEHGRSPAQVIGGRFGSLI